MFNAVVAYATTYAITRTKSTVGTVTNNDCSAITIMPTTNHVIMACGVGGGTTWTIRLVDGTSQTASSAVTIVANSQTRSKFFAINDNTAVFSTGATATGNAMFREYQISGVTLTNTRTFNVPCGSTSSDLGAFSESGTSVWFTCSDGTVREFGLLTFTQLNSYSGLTTGTPTCTNERGVAMASSTVGLAICDTDTAILFHLSGGSVVKDDSITLTNSYASGTSGFRWFYSGGNYYFYSLATANTAESIQVTISGTPNIVSTTPVALPIGTINDAVVATGGYYLFSGATDNVIYLLDSNSNPPNNFVTTFSMGGNDIEEDSNWGSNDGETFVYSKGDNGNTTIYYYKFTDLLVDGETPTTGGGGSTPNGIDCTDPTYSYRLMCNVNSGALAGASETIGQNTCNLLNQIGLIDCADNADIKTNGVGYIILVVSIAIMIGIFWVASRGQLQEIPTFVWFVGIIGVAGLLTVIDYIDATVLVLVVVAVVAFAVAKVRGFLGGQQMFAGEAT